MLLLLLHNTGLSVSILLPYIQHATMGQSIGTATALSLFSSNLSSFFLLESPSGDAAYRSGSLDDIPAWGLFLMPLEHHHMRLVAQSFSPFRCGNNNNDNLIDHSVCFLQMHSLQLFVLVLVFFSSPWSARLLATFWHSQVGHPALFHSDQCKSSRYRSGLWWRKQKPKTSTRQFSPQKMSEQQETEKGNRTQTNLTDPIDSLEASMSVLWSPFI